MWWKHIFFWPSREWGQIYPGLYLVDGLGPKLKMSILVSSGWENEAAVDSNLTAIHQSPNCVASGKKCCFVSVYDTVLINNCGKKAVSVNQEVSKQICLWVIFQFPRGKVFACWRITYVCVSPLIFLSYTAGHDICAWRAWMEDISYKWGKEGNFWFSAFQCAFLKMHDYFYVNDCNIDFNRSEWGPAICFILVFVQVCLSSWEIL